MEKMLGFLWALLLLMLVLAFTYCVHSIKEHKRLEQELKQDQCVLTLEQETGTKIYCGKDCWRAEIQKEYSCKSGKKIVKH